MCLKSYIISFITHHPRLQESIMPWLIITYQIPKRVLFILFSLFPIHSSKVVISNFGGKDYGDNSKYVAEVLLKERFFTDIVWMVGSNPLLHENHLPEQIRLVKNGSVKEIYEYASAKVWIDNTTKAWYFRKRRNQIYVQLWHGTAALKHIKADCAVKQPLLSLLSSKQEARNCDLVVSGSSQHTQVYHSAFIYKCPILESGSPKNDILIDESVNVSKKSMLVDNITGYEKNSTKKILLYAPTFRDGLNMDVYDLDIKQVLSMLHGTIGGEWLCLLRLHPAVATKSSELKIDENITIDVSNYPDMQELLCISDVLITDYSSSMFDFILTKRPCFLYTPDASEYQNERGYYMSFDELPFPRGNTNDELIEAIHNFDNDDYQQKIRVFKEKIGLYDKGNAGKAVVDWIKKKIESE